MVSLMSESLGDAAVFSYSHVLRGTERFGMSGSIQDVKNLILTVLCEQACSVKRLYINPLAPDFFF